MDRTGFIYNFYKTITSWSSIFLLGRHVFSKIVHRCIKLVIIAAAGLFYFEQRHLIIFWTRCSRILILEQGILTFSADNRLWPFSLLNQILNSLLLLLLSFKGRIRDLLLFSPIWFISYVWWILCLKAVRSILLLFCIFLKIFRLHVEWSDASVVVTALFFVSSLCFLDSLSFVLERVGCWINCRTFCHHGPKIFFLHSHRTRNHQLLRFDYCLQWLLRFNFLPLFFGKGSKQILRFRMDLFIFNIF